MYTERLQTDTLDTIRSPSCPVPSAAVRSVETNAHEEGSLAGKCEMTDVMPGLASGGAAASET